MALAKCKSVFCLSPLALELSNIHVSRRFISLSAERNALKSIIPIKWVRPEKVPCYKPEVSGDLKPLIELPKDMYPLELKDSEELKTADDTVKRLFTLQYFPYKKTVEVLREEYLKKTRRHMQDVRSQEARVAKMTADIRDMQRRVNEFPLEKHTKIRLKETIDKRKKCLKLFRESDYKCFEWTLDQLDLFYKPFPPKTCYMRIERKRSLRMLTEKYCENIINTKFQKYRESLEAQQESFLVNKIETMKWAMKEQKECGVTPTITEEDVQKVQQQLDELRKLKKIETVLQE